MKAILAGGGTGGHIFPGIALALEFKRRDPKNQLLFVGTANGMENTILPKHGFPFAAIRARGLIRTGWSGKLKALTLLPASLLDALKIIRSFKPQLVIGLGGYASGPAVGAACLLGIKTAILEQNIIPGLANRLLARFTRTVFVSFPESSQAFPRGRAVCTGNPIRAEIANLSTQQKNGSEFSLLVLGGSRGAASLNKALTDALDHLSQQRDRFRIIHQTGWQEVQRVEQSYRQKGFQATVVPFIEEMSQAYSQADLVVSRAGATTIAEVSCAGIPALLIPYPYAAQDHQRRNAQNLVEKGAAVMIEPGQISGEALAQNLLELMNDRSRLASMSARMRAHSRPDAARQIVDICCRMVEA